MDLIPRKFYLDDFFDSFVSTKEMNNMKCDIYEKDGDYHIEILAPIGTNGAYIEELMFNEHYYQHLNEWILPQNTIYKTLLKDYELKKAIIIILGDGINEF